ncbi:hypothetical protein O3P69_020949, partial [Scylla paramamosain]
MIHQQQRFLESLDAKERQRSLIITGPPEDRDDLGATDDEKVMNVMNACGVLTQHTVDAGTTVVMGDFNATVGEWVPVMLSADGDPGSK